MIAKNVGRGTYLSPFQMFRLDEACKPIHAAFSQTPYLVGSALERADYRDVDVRLMLPDKEYDALQEEPGTQALRFLAFTVSAYLQQATGLPVDFQFQRRTDANKRHNKPRNPLGQRSLVEYVGDA